MNNYCKKCGNRLAFDTQTCVTCGQTHAPIESEKKGRSYGWVFPLYIFVEVFGFLYSLSLADLRNSDNATHTYVALRIILLIASISIFLAGKEHESTSLEIQGGCFLFFNLLIVGFVLYLVIIGL